MVSCLNKKLLGIDCPGCGLQRSIVLLAQGDFIEAFKMYPAIYTIVPLFLLIGIKFFYKFKYSSKIINLLSIFTVIIIIVSYIIKIS